MYTTGEIFTLTQEGQNFSPWCDAKRLVAYRRDYYSQGEIKSVTLKNEWVMWRIGYGLVNVGIGFGRRRRVQSKVLTWKWLSFRDGGVEQKSWVHIDAKQVENNLRQERKKSKLCSWQVGQCFTCPLLPIDAVRVPPNRWACPLSKACSCNFRLYTKKLKNWN